MGNIDAPRGFRAVKNEAGTAPRLTPYEAADSINIFDGEILALSTGGQAVSYTDTLAIEGQLIGVAAHFVAAAETDDRTVMVYDDPMQEYAVQADGADITALTDYRFKLFDVTSPKTGNTTLLTSTSELDASSASSLVATATLDAAGIRPLLCLDKIRSRENEIGSGITWTQFKIKIAPPCHVSGMAKVGLAAATTFTGSS